MFNSRQATAGTHILYENQLIESNLCLVFHIVHRFRSSYFAQDELISVGYIGLIKAARTYRSERSVQFSTYASRCITNEILMFLRRNVKHLKVLSLDAPVRSFNEDSPPAMMDLIGGCDERIEHGLEREEERRALLKAVSRLSPRNRALISMRYGLYGQRQLRQEEIAANLGISQSYVSRLEKQCLRRLRKMLV